VFDSSDLIGRPSIFYVSGSPKWLSEIFASMRVGDKYEIYVPYDLAKNWQPTLFKIPEQSVMIFKIEILRTINNTNGKDK
jgi:FKBP-type peptidyl-prolyl cis-trans isomerase